MTALIRRPTGRDIPLWLETVLRNTEREINKAAFLGTFNVAAVPPASLNAGRIIYVPDESGGPALAFSDGTNWLGITLGGIIS